MLNPAIKIGLLLLTFKVLVERLTGSRKQFDQVRNITGVPGTGGSKEIGSGQK